MNWLVKSELFFQFFYQVFGNTLCALILCRRLAHVNCGRGGKL